MKKVTAFVGSARRKNTYHAVEMFLNRLQAFEEVETEIVMLGDYQLGICRGCQLCFNQGAQFCPLKDDRDLLFDKVKTSDGVILATPNYTWDMSGLMKVFLDRFGYACHRPQYFGKAFTSIVVEAVGRGDKIVDTLNWTANILGFNTLKGITITAFDPRTEKQQKAIENAITRQSKKFYTLLSHTAYPSPTLLQLMMFRIGRTMVLRKADPASLDYRYYSDKGWFQSEYYYNVRLGIWDKAAGRLFDSLIVAALKLSATVE